MIATNVMFREMGEGYGYVICADKPLPKPDDGEEDSGDGDELPEGEGEPAETPAEPPKAIRLTVFTDDKNVFSFSAEEYDLESVVHIDGAIVLKKVDGSAVTAVNCLSGESGEYKELHRADSTLLVMNAESGYIYLDRYARPIMESRYEDMENVLVYEDVNILFSASFAADRNNVSRKDNLYYHIASFGKAVKELELKRTETMEPGENHDGEIGWFILTGEDGKKKLFTPLADNLLSESYDSIDTYTESRIGFVIGRDVRNRRYDVIDVFTGAVVASIPFSKEGDERLQISSSGSKYSGEIDKYNIASVPGDPNSVIPLDIVQVRKLAKDKTTAENITYYAVYRSAAYGDENYLGAKLCFTELGTDYIMKESFELSESFARNNILPFITPAGAQIYSFDAEKKLVRLGETEYEIDSLVSDTDSEKLYFRITNGCGGYGLANIDGSVIISPVYESIGNTVNGEYITARRGDAYGILRMEESGVTVAVDFVYSGISALVDGGFWAYNSNNDYVFIHNGRIEIRKPVSNKSITVYNYVQDENGTRVYEDKGLSYGGSYYFHKATYPQKLNVKLDLDEKYR